MNESTPRSLTLWAVAALVLCAMASVSTEVFSPGRDASGADAQQG